eukprot:TRINITY_DN171_c5_g1_i1.p1 TRINITY_DN171_c5_g1~~TRINITY_DN171_c5_g1_i1.p1  ORF type:complete len:733 (-),score=236.06 TRINITY_DN171_c5_g1_i1:23-2221(-)
MSTEKVEPQVESPSTETMETEAAFPAFVAVDFGNNEIVLAICNSHDNFPTIVRNDTSETGTKNLVSFKNAERLFGEGAVGHTQINPQNSAEQIFSLLGKSQEELGAFTVPVAAQEEDGNLTIELPYAGEKKKIYPEHLAAMLLVRLQKYLDDHTLKFQQTIRDVFFMVPPQSTPRHLKAISQAAKIANFNVRGFVTSAEAVASVYATKRASDDGSTKHVVFVDMGLTHFTLSFSKLNKEGAQVLFSTSSPIGGQALSNRLFHHVCSEISKKYNVDVKKNARYVCRLYAAITKAKAILGTVAETKVTLSLPDEDASISVTKSLFENLCNPDLTKLRTQITEFQTKIAAYLQEAGEGAAVDEVQIVGGGTRVPMIQRLLTETFGTTLSFKLDSSLDLAVGTAICGASRTPGYKINLQVTSTDSFIATEWESKISEETRGLTDSQLTEAIELEKKMQATDADLVNRCHLKNTLEMNIFAHREHLSDSKWKDCFDDAAKKEEFENLLNALALYLDDCNVHVTATSELEEKTEELKQGLQNLVPKLVEKLEQEAKDKAKADAEAAANAVVSPVQSTGEKTRTNKEKLEVSKARKEEGNKHFVNNDYPAAVTRYTQSLELARSLYDETPEQLEEAKAIKLACYLNLAQCLIKVGAYTKAIDNCKAALSIDPKNAKGFFRRGNAYFANREFEEAQKDFLEASKLLPNDRSVKVQLDKANKMVALLKEKEKQMYAKMFSK